MKAISFGKVGLRIAILAVGALAFSLPLLDPRFAVVAFVATVPWLLLIFSPNLKGRERWPLWFLGQIYAIALLALIWLAHFSLAAWLISPLFYIPLVLPTFYVAAKLREKWSALPMSIVWGLSLTGTEWLRIRISPGEIPFCQLGASLVPFQKLIQIVDVAGPSGLTTVAAIFSGLMVDLTLYLTTAGPRRSWRNPVLSSAVVLVIFVTSVWYGYRRDVDTTFSPGPKVEVIQTNMPGWGDDISSRLKFQRAVDLTLANKPMGDVDLVIWPENSVIPPLQKSGSVTTDPEKTVIALSRSINVPILFDGPFDRLDLSERHRAALVVPDGTVTSYMKQELVPWSEYAPFEPTLRAINSAAADKWLLFIRSRSPYFTSTRVDDNAPITIFRFAGRNGRPVVFGSPICYEILSPSLVNRWYAKLDEDARSHFFLINQVNEFLIGKAVHAQTLAFCKLRAIEGRVTVIRAANNGISAAIDPNGRLRDVLIDPATGSSIDVAGTFTPQVILDSRAGRTLYARYGDWWPVTCLLTSIILIIVGYARSLRMRLTKTKAPEIPGRNQQS